MTENIQHILDSKALPATSPFCHLVVDDLYAYVAGRVAADLPGHEEILGDIYAETHLIMTSFQTLLQEIGLNLDRATQVLVHLVDLNDMPDMDRAYGEFFQAGHYPARTCIESPKLFGGSHVEITCTVRR